MAETYCGKVCAECAQREALGCPGCKSGPGRQLGGDCELAKCVRTKGHETCDTCSFKGTCGTRMGMGYMPEKRLRNREWEIAQQAAVAERAVVLGKWLWVMFWLHIIGWIPGVMTNETVAEAVPALLLPGEILTTVLNVILGLIFLGLREQNERYRTVGVITLVGIPLVYVQEYVAAKSDALYSVFLIIVMGALSLYTTYQEYTAHAEVLAGVDENLSEKWCKLWTWEIILLGVLLGDFLIVALSSFLGLLVALVGGIGIVVITILRIVYLFKTAVVFRDIAARS